MSIDLIGVSHSMKPKRARTRIELRDINIHIEPHTRVAIMGQRGNGIEELTNIMCGAIYPARGHVILSSEISWPIGEAGFLVTDATLAVNLRFVARVYEVDESEYARHVADVADVQDYWQEKLSALPRELRSRFVFALGVCLPFDIYVFESPETADKTFRERAQEIVEQLAEQFGIVVITAKGSMAEKYCQSGYVLDDGKITHYEDIAVAVAHLERLGEGSVVEEDVEEEYSERDQDEADVF